MFDDPRRHAVRPRVLISVEPASVSHCLEPEIFIGVVDRQTTPLFAIGRIPRVGGAIAT